MIWHWPVAQGTFREILKAIVMISHRSALDLPSPYYSKIHKKLKTLKFHNPVPSTADLENDAQHVINVT